MEEILGRILAPLQTAGLTLTTKASPTVSGSLSPAAVAEQLGRSLQRLGVASVQLFTSTRLIPGPPLRSRCAHATSWHGRGSSESWA